MATTETDVERWTRRAKDAAAEAVRFGGGPDEIRAAVEAGIREGQRDVNILAGTVAREARPANRYVPEQGSAIADLLRATA